jgi:hypothetical protein
MNLKTPATERVAAGKDYLSTRNRCGQSKRLRQLRGLFGAGGEIRNERRNHRSSGPNELRQAVASYVRDPDVPGAIDGDTCPGCRTSHCARHRTLLQKL